MAGREAREEARRLVVHEGYTYAEAAEATGIPTSTLQKWGSAEEWKRQADSSMSYKGNVRAAKTSCLERLSVMLANQNADADAIGKVAATWRSLEMAFPEHRYNAKQDPRLRITIAIEVLEGLAEYLLEQDRTALAAMEPHIKPFATWWESRCQTA